MTRLRKPTLSKVRHKPTSAQESLLENRASGYSVWIQRTGSGTRVRVVASPDVDITHLLSALHRAHPDASIRINRRH